MKWPRRRRAGGEGRRGGDEVSGGGAESEHRRPLRNLDAPVTRSEGERLRASEEVGRGIARALGQPRYWEV